MSTENEIISESLRKKYQAIRDLDFEGAKSLDEEIKEKTKANSSRRFQEIIAAAKRALADLLENRKLVVNNFIETRHKESCDLYAKFQSIVNRMEDVYTNKLNELDREKQIMLEEQGEQDIPAFYELLEAAKESGLNGQFDQAAELRQKAYDVRDSEWKAIRMKIEGSFDLAKEEALKEHTQEKAELNEQYKQELVKLQKKAKEEEAHALNTFSWKVANIKNIAQVQISAYDCTEESRNEAIRVLNESFEDMMAEFRKKPVKEIELTTDEKMRLTTMCPQNRSEKRDVKTPDSRSREPSSRHSSRPRTARSSKRS